MKSDPSSLQRLALPLKVIAQRVGFLFLLFAAVTLLVLGKADIVVVERVRTAIMDTAAPALEALSQPVTAVNALFDRVSELMYLREENQRLREENSRLLQWQAVARKLEQHNAALRSLLNVETDPQISYVTARVVGDSGGAYVRTLVLNAGRRDGVRKNQAVVATQGLIGRVVEVGERSSRVLLILDLNSRIPVLLQGSRYRGILAGNNSNRLNLLTFHSPAVQVPVGELVVTSGHGGMFPSDLPVGVVVTSQENLAQVQPLVDWNRMEYVRVVRYELAPLDDIGSQ